MSFSGIFCIFTFVLASKQAKFKNREQEAATRGKKKYAKRIFKWKVFSDNRMGNQGNQLFISFLQ